MADNEETNPEAVLNEDQRLLDDFSPHSYEEWKQAAEDLLKGKPFDKLLIAPTHEGFDIQPIYMQQDVADLPHMRGMPGLGNHVRGGKASGYLRDSWEISQEYTSPVPEDLRNWIVRELCLGVTEANILCDAPTRKGVDADSKEATDVGVCGVSLSSLRDLEKIFDGVYLEMVPLYFQSGMSGLPVLAGLVSLMEKRELGLEYLKGCVEIDPLGYGHEHGALPTSLEAAYDEMAAATRFAVEKLPNMQTLHVSTQPYHKAGASSSQEMAFALATMVDYVRAMQKRGVEAVDALSKVRLSLAIGPNFYLEIAKFRALRMLCAKVAEAFGASETQRSVHLHARTGQFNKSRLDAHTNMLRTTTEAFSAVIGGVDSLHVAWFDEVVREPDEFSRRIARNIQTILKEECDMTRVVDVAGGSWAIETFTHQMAEQAWKLFQEIEKQGGMAAALEAGMPQQACAEVFANKQKKVRQRREVLVGVNMYSNATEKPLPPRDISYTAIAKNRAEAVSKVRAEASSEKATALDGLDMENAVVTAKAALEAGATFGEVLGQLREGRGSYEFKPVAQRRAAVDYEELRYAASRFAAKTGKAPQILQANIGPSRRYRGRADWTSAFFQAAGFEMLNDEDFNSAEEAANRLRSSEAKIAIITSDDDTYAEKAEEVSKALKSANPGATIILAGALNDDLTAKVKAAGVDDFVHMKVNNYDFNRKLLETLGVL